MKPAQSAEGEGIFDHAEHVIEGGLTKMVHKMADFLADENATTKADLAAEKNRAYVTIQICGASGLQASDRDGKADPYCVVSLGGQKWRTTGKRNTLSPEWDETCTFVLKSYREVMIEPLTIEVGRIFSTAAPAGGLSWQVECGFNCLRPTFRHQPSFADFII